VEKIVYAAVALTLIVAGCSLAVAAGGGLVDRKRPFTLLRVGGAPVGVLSLVVLLEAAVPRLGQDYYALMGLGLAAAFGVITATLPLLRRMTSPGSVHFE
jgi:hypothetical protein